MDGIPQEELQRLMIFEENMKQATAEYKRNPKDVENLTKLGRNLVELAQFMQGPDAVEMIDDAVSKLEEAVTMAPKKHDALWWLGNAHTTKGFQTPEAVLAHASFQKAAVVFRQALEIEPRNEAYRKSLEVSLKAPELHEELHKQMAMQAAVTGMGQGGAESSKAPKKKKSSDLWYDVAGWVVLAVGLVTYLGFVNMRAAAAAPPAPGGSFR